MNRKRRCLMIIAVILSLASCNTTKKTVFPEEMYEGDEIKMDEHFFKDIKNFKSEKEDIEKVFKDNYIDEENLINKDTITYGELYLSDKRSENLTYISNNEEDAHYIFYANNKARAISRAKGYALTLPTSKTLMVNFDYSIYRDQYISEEFTLSISNEKVNPDRYTWDIYHDEWIFRYLCESASTSKEQVKTYMNSNNLAFTRNNVKINKNLLEGFECEIYSVEIKDHEQIEKPFYNIAVVRPSNARTFSFIVMKSKTNMDNEFDEIIKSFRKIPSFGKANKVKEFDLKVPSYLSEETQKYYKKLMEQNYTEWGIFSYSMYNNPQHRDSQEAKIRSRKNALESLMDYDFGIMPTYSHCGRLTDDFQETFPLQTANEFAGGNGFNNKPVIQYTLQFTASNNEGLYGYTPMFDILRGKYDDYFKKLASDIKAYGKPVLFRLNNEMNSDWVSYCGQVTLMDPDIFSLTWERMAKILKDEGCDNILYIFNPTGKTYPFCNWGEDLCYLPSLKYVQILGLTYYEYNNYTNGEEPQSFYELYNWLYEKNTPQFKKYPAIISEFACGAGGETTGKAYRNKDTQANWVVEAFDLLNSYRTDDMVNQIKGAVWFDANDYYGNQVKNLLVLDEYKTSGTIKAFKAGLNDLKKIKKMEK